MRNLFKRGKRQPVLPLHSLENRGEPALTGRRPMPRVQVNGPHRGVQELQAVLQEAAVLRGLQVEGIYGNTKQLLQERAVLPQNEAEVRLGVLPDCDADNADCLPVQGLESAFVLRRGHIHAQATACRPSPEDAGVLSPECPQAFLFVFFLAYSRDQHDEGAGQRLRSAPGRGCNRRQIY